MDLCEMHFFMRYISYIVYVLSELLKCKRLLTAVYFILNCKILTHQLTPPAEVEEAGGVAFNAKLLKYMTHTHTHIRTYSHYANAFVNLQIN